jgi:hypothetical protein
MKTRVQWTWSLGLILVSLPLENQYAQQAPGEPANSPPAVAPEGQANPPASGLPSQNSAPAAQGTQTDLADGAFQPISA